MTREKSARWSPDPRSGSLSFAGLAVSALLLGMVVLTRRTGSDFWWVMNALLQR